jgi:hypothetical protein
MFRLALIREGSWLILGCTLRRLIEIFEMRRNNGSSAGKRALPYTVREYAATV